MQHVQRALFRAVVTFHMLVIFGLLYALVVLPFRADWFVALPLTVYIVYLLTTRVECPLTNLENALRRRLGMKRIGGFVGHYVFKPVKIALGIKKPLPK